MPSTYSSIISSLGVVYLPRSALMYLTVSALSLVPQIHCMQITELPPALPSGAFSSSSTFAPASAAVIATEAPAPPKPMTTASYSASQFTVFSKASFFSSAIALTGETRPAAASPSAPIAEPFRKSLLEMLLFMTKSFLSISQTKAFCVFVCDSFVKHSVDLDKRPCQAKNSYKNSVYFVRFLFILSVSFSLRPVVLWP